MCQQFVALLRGGIEADGVVHLVVGRVGYLLVGAIDAGRGGIDEVLYFNVNVNLNLNFGCAFLFVRVNVSVIVNVIIGVAAGFEDVVEADEVGLDIGIGVGDAIADTSLGSEVDHNLRMVFGEDAVDEGAVGDVAADEGEGRGTRLEGLFYFLEACFLEAHVVVVVHRVDADDMDVIDGVEQLFGEVGSDESLRR